MSSDMTTLDSLTVTAGSDKSGNSACHDIIFTPGEITALLGPTGSGKSRFLSDIESLADNDTPSGRKILLNETPPDPDQRFELQGRLVAQLTQNMNFVLDMAVDDFILTHAKSREVPTPEETTEKVIAAANDLAGEPFAPRTQLTQLSGGQSRALMIADAALLSWSPVLLIDEIENAGVDKLRALDLLVKSDKIVVIATHDPVLALSATRRLVFEHGAVHAVLSRTQEEQDILARLTDLENTFSHVRSQLRLGKPLTIGER
ncbi:ATP-binding cassette domain-containing protein [Desulfovibrio inopinatus]|uniref:ATP-binding cassette domain-containing protein n=1 Tax=Desulfovibrio inopinatus TaxID=102109 RepID=UPI000402FEAE|nr:ATP-binding cassette domain-containing protein [Desulfovibrio inopinatus]